MLLILCSNVSLDVFPCLFVFFVCWRCRFLEYVVFLLHLSQNHKFVLAVWSLGVTCIRFVTHNARNLSQLIVDGPVFACIHTDRLHACAFGWCDCSVLCNFSDVCANMRAYFWVRERVTCRSGRVCSLFMDCKEVLSVSVRAAEWLELVKPFSSPWSNPGDCCVDATLTAITDKFKRL